MLKISTSKDNSDYEYKISSSLKLSFVSIERSLFFIYFRLTCKGGKDTGTLHSWNKTSFGNCVWGGVIMRGVAWDQERSSTYWQPIDQFTAKRSTPAKNDQEKKSVRNSILSHLTRDNHGNISHGLAARGQ